MSTKVNLSTEVEKIFAESWDNRDGQKIPQPEDLKLSNEGLKLNGTILYADLAESTNLVESESPEFAAEVYKSYLHCASRIIKRYNGEITSFDGDRIMAVYIGDYKNTNAVRSALAINHAVVEIINPAIGKQYPSKSYRVKHAVGIDTSSMLVARTGIRNNNDLVWVGKAANIAAKLCAFRYGNISTWITQSTYDQMNDTTRLHEATNMWQKILWPNKNIYVYGSSYRWSVD